MLQNGGRSYELYLSEAILEETRRVLLSYPRLRKRYPYSDEDVEEFIQWLRDASHVLSKCPRIAVVKEDPKDDIVLACALKARADYIVSKDDHLKDLKEYRGIKILSTDEFLQLLAHQERGARGQSGARWKQGESLG